MTGDLARFHPFAAPDGRAVPTRPDGETARAFVFYPRAGDGLLGFKRERREDTGTGDTVNICNLNSPRGEGTEPDTFTIPYRVIGPE